MAIPLTDGGHKHSGNSHAKPCPVLTAVIFIFSGRYTYTIEVLGIILPHTTYSFDHVVPLPYRLSKTRPELQNIAKSTTGHRYIHAHSYLEQTGL